MDQASAKDFMLKIKECSQSDLADKSIVGSLMGELTTEKFDWSQPIHDHVTHMSNLASKLKALGLESASSNKGKPSKKDKKDKAFMKGPESQVHKEKKCFFCKKMGHFKKDV